MKDIILTILVHFFSFQKIVTLGKYSVRNLLIIALPFIHFLLDLVERAIERAIKERRKKRKTCIYLKYLMIIIVLTSCMNDAPL